MYYGVIIYFSKTQTMKTTHSKVTWHQIHHNTTQWVPTITQAACFKLTGTHHLFIWFIHSLTFTSKMVQKNFVLFQMQLFVILLSICPIFFLFLRFYLFIYLFICFSIYLFICLFIFIFFSIKNDIGRIRTYAPDGNCLAGSRLDHSATMSYNILDVWTV